MSSKDPPKTAFRAELWDTPCPPSRVEAWGEDQLRALADGMLVIQGRQIIDYGPTPEVCRRHPDLIAVDLRGSLLVPGFVDTHVHFPQLDIIGASGEHLLGWLNRYTYPHEMRFAEASYAEAAAERFATELLANGTTTAAIYTTSHLTAAEAMLRTAYRRGLRAIIGKVSMDRHAPAGLLSSATRDRLDTEKLIAEWHGRDERLYIALTPRFALACSEDMLATLGSLAAQDPSLYIQTHHAENRSEIAAVAEHFCKDEHYLAVYDRFGLVGSRTILAHSIYATDCELDLMAKREAAIAHCPSSNFFLGSGLFRMQAVQSRSIRVGLGSDIGGGTSFSSFRTMDAAYKMQKIQDRILCPTHLFYLATQGGADALSLGDRIGSFAPGKRADFIVLTPERSRLLKTRFQQVTTPWERLAALITLGDDRLVERVYVDGLAVYERPATLT